MRTPVQHVYGVEFSDGRVTVVRAYHRKRETVFESLANGMNVAGDASWTSIAEQLKSDQQSDHALVSSSVFTQESFIRPVATPLRSIKKATSILPSLLDVQLPFPLEKCRHQFANVHNTADGTVRSVALAVPDERLQSTLDQLGRAGIEPDVMDQEALALWRYTRKSIPPVSSRPRIILYLGYDRTVAVVGNDREPFTAFSARTALTPETETVQRERLLLRLRQFLAGALREMTSPDAQPGYVVTGPMASSGAEDLRKNLVVDPTHWQTTEHSDFWLARALADAQLNEDAWSINLRTGSFAHPNTSRRAKKEQRVLGTSVSLAALFLILVSYSSALLASRSHATVQAAVQESARALTGSAYIPRGQEIFLAEQFVKSSAEKFRIFQQFLEPTAYPIFSEILSLSRQRGVMLDTLSVRPESIIARGAGTDWKDAEFITDPLSERKWKVVIERNDAGTDERVHFTARAQK
jgi:hypothetical protein